MWVALSQAEMRYGLFVSAQYPENADLGRILHEHLEQVRFAADNGFSSVFAGQHFLSTPFLMLQPVPLLARLAAEENLAFGVTSRRARVLESKLDVVRRLLEGERVTAEGPGYRLEDAAIGVRPIAEPRPPIWMAANSDAAVKRAARVADTWFANPHVTVEELQRQLDFFRQERGSAPTELPAMREVCVRRKDDEAIDVARPSLTKSTNPMSHGGRVRHYRR